MGATHDPNINIQVILASIARSRAGFGVPLLVAEIGADDRVLTFVDPDPQELDQMVEEGDITTDVKERLQDAFAQQPRVNEIKVGRKDDGESYEEALNAIEQEDDVWYGLAIESRAAADIVEISDWALERMVLFVAQSDDEQWLSSGIPDDFDDDENDVHLTGDHERTIMVWHDDNGEALDLAWLANRLSFDPDVQSAPWDGHRIRRIDPYTTSMTSGDRSDAFENKVNLMLPYGPENRVMDPGVTFEGDEGRPVYEMITRDWFEFRLEDRIARAKIQYSDRGEKIPLGNEGISVMRPVVEGLILEGVEAGHFVEDEWEVEFHDPTEQDIDEQRLRASGVVQLAVSARQFDMTFNFQRDPVTEDD